jgi:hypothetical protein
MDRKSHQVNSELHCGREQLNSYVSKNFRRLLDWHCDMEQRRRPRRPTIGEFIEVRLTPILEKEGKPPAEYLGHKRRPRSNGKKRGPKRAGLQSVSQIEVA